MNVAVDRFVVLPITFRTGSGYATLDPSANIDVDITYLPSFDSDDGSIAVSTYNIFNPLSDPNVCILSFQSSKRGIYMVRVTYTGAETLSEPTTKYFVVTCGNDYDPPLKHTYVYNPLTGNVSEVHTDYYKDSESTETIFEKKVVGFVYEEDGGEARLTEVTDKNE